MTKQNDALDIWMTNYTLDYVFCKILNKKTCYTF